MKKLLLLTLVLSTAGCSATMRAADWRRPLRGIVLPPFPEPTGQYAICGSWPGYICSGGR